MRYLNESLRAFAAMAALVAVVAQAADDEKHEGTVISASDGKLVTADADGIERAYDVGEAALITCDGKTCKLTDLKKGFKVTVTTNEENAVTAVDAVSANLLRRQALR